eukprot:jgi/Mesvir1/27996/Mv20193-RA.4
MADGGKKVAFAVVRKKTPFQKHKEEEEARKKRADEEAAAVYADFVKSFDPSEANKTAFVRGEVIDPNTGRVSTPASGTPPTTTPGKAPLLGGKISVTLNAKPGSPLVAIPKKGIPAPKVSISLTPPATSARKTGGKYVPSFTPPGMAAALGQGEDEGDEAAEEPAPPPKEDKKKASRNIDAFMEELKREQEVREKGGEPMGGPDASKMPPIPHGRFPPRPGSRFDELPPLPPPMMNAGKGILAVPKIPFGIPDSGDPNSTNLYVGNLAPTVDETMLMKEFSPYGDIASVKVMWPRTEEEHRRQRNCGFVAFMDREGATRALIANQGKVLNGHEIRIGWGKGVPVPSKAICLQGGPIPKVFSSVMARPIGGASISEPTAAVNAAPWMQAGVVEEVIAAKAAAEGEGGDRPAAPVYPKVTPPAEPHPEYPDVVVQVPKSERVRAIIDLLAKYVAMDGCALEQVILEQQRRDPEYIFLFDLGSADHAYYRWRLFALCSGDTMDSWREEPFVMVEGGARWIPPKMPEKKEPPPAPTPTVSTPLSKPLSEETKAAKGPGAGASELPPSRLTDEMLDQFEDMLRSLTMDRGDILNAMVWAMDHAAEAAEVAELITDSLTLSETPIPTKVARLFLVSDILHNSGSVAVKHAAAYRREFESRLPEIFESFNELFRSITGRMTLHTLKDHVQRVLRAWSSWFLFSDGFLTGLEATFCRKVAIEAGARAATEGREGGAEAEASAEQVAAELADGALAIGGDKAAELRALPAAELDRRCRHNGLSQAGGKEAKVQRLLHLAEFVAQRDTAPMGAAPGVSSTSNNNARGGGGGGAGPGSTPPSGNATWLRDRTGDAATRDTLATDNAKPGAGGAAVGGKDASASSGNRGAWVSVEDPSANAATEASVTRSRPQSGVWVDCTGGGQAGVVVLNNGAMDAAGGGAGVLGGVAGAQGVPEGRPGSGAGGSKTGGWFAAPIVRGAVASSSVGERQWLGVGMAGIKSPATATTGAPTVASSAMLPPSRWTSDGGQQAGGQEGDRRQKREEEAVALPVSKWSMDDHLEEDRSKRRRSASPTEAAPGALGGLAEYGMHDMDQEVGGAATGGGAGAVEETKEDEERRCVGHDRMGEKNGSWFRARPCGGEALRWWDGAPR